MKIKKGLVAAGVVISSLALAGMAFAHAGASEKPPMSLQINSDGKVVVQNAEVTGISGSDIAAKIVLNGATITGTIRTNSSTEFIGPQSSDSLAKIAVGDHVNARGSFVAGAGATILASSVREMNPKAGVIVGTVSSTNAGANSFVLATRTLGDFTVKIGSGTKIMFGRVTGTLANISTGAAVRVRGAIDSVLHTVQADHVEIKTSADINSGKSKDEVHGSLMGWFFGKK